MDDRRLTVVVSDAALYDELRSTLIEGSECSFGVSAGPPEPGFGETLYPILVTWGVTALPASMVASLIAAWVYDAARHRGLRKEDVVGVEAPSGRTLALRLDDVDVERIATRLAELLADHPKAGNATDRE